MGITTSNSIDLIHYRYEDDEVKNNQASPFNQVIFRVKAHV